VLYSYSYDQQQRCQPLKSLIQQVLNLFLSGSAPP
jgi:hypothetical protein